MLKYDSVTYPQIATKIYEAFTLKMGYAPTDERGAIWISSPGRVNLIGEHLDYNGGHVFPCALTMGITGLFCPRQDDKVHMFSTNFAKSDVVWTNLKQKRKQKGIGWGNYVMGIVETMRQDGKVIANGFDLVIGSTLPEASGLSSSAALELLVATALNHHYSFGYSEVELALLSQKTEREFIGVNCGIMDQYAVAMGKANRAMYLDTDTLACEYALLDLEAKGLSLVIASSNKKRGLADSKYNDRRSECEAALADLQQVNPEIANLCSLNPEQFDKIKHQISDEVCLRRAEHVVSEEARTLRAVSALQASDFQLFGELMTASHISLRDDYEVTGIALDTLVDSALKQEGVLGSRMTGAGFGGCTVTLVETKKMTEAFLQIGLEYHQVMGFDADFYVAKAAQGCVVLDASPLAKRQ